MPLSLSIGFYRRAFSAARDVSTRMSIVSVFFHLISSFCFTWNEATFNGNLQSLTRVKKVSDSSGAKKSPKGMKEIINPTPGLVYPTVNIREDVDMHFFSTRDFHTMDRSIRAGFDVDGLDPEANDVNDAFCTTVDMSKVHGSSSWMMAGNEQGAETIHAMNHSFAMEDVNFVDTMVPQDVITKTGTDSA
ncbi:hypothetical protein AAC387_Pa02g1358 [Persea americana]